MSLQASDYLKLPDRIDNFIRVTLDDKARKQYEELKQTAILEAEGITAVSAAALMTKLLQLFRRSHIRRSRRSAYHTHSKT